MKKLLILTALISSIASLNAVQQTTEELAQSIEQAVEAGQSMQIAQAIQDLNAACEQRSNDLKQAFDLALQQSEALTQFSSRLDAAVNAKMQAEDAKMQAEDAKKQAEDAKWQAYGVAAGAVVGVAIKIAHDKGKCTIL
jgi:hypothetical protein